MEAGTAACDTATHRCCFLVELPLLLCERKKKGVPEGRHPGFMGKLLLLPPGRQDRVAPLFGMLTRFTLVEQVVDYRSSLDGWWSEWSLARGARWGA